MIEISRRALLGGVAATALVGLPRSPRPEPVGYLAGIVDKYSGPLVEVLTNDSALVYIVEQPEPITIGELRRRFERYAFDVRGMEIGTDG